MGTIIGIPSTRVSDAFIRQRVINQMLSDQLELFRIQTQLSTGRRIQMPSEDANAALRIISLQRLLERKEQVQTNLRTGQSYLTATDTALSTVSDSLAEARGVALGAVGTTATDTEREAAALQIQETLRQLVDVANQQFRGRYLFAGANTAVRPFEIAGSNLVQYLGDEGRLSSYSDIHALFDTNVHGSEVFGAISQPVLGTVDVDPILTFQTRLTDLRGGQGITRGSIAISDGSSTSIIDIGIAETVGDVAALIRAGAGAITLNVAITPTGLKIEGGPGEMLTIREVGTGTTAEELGILTTTPANTVVGSNLDPALRLTTRLDDLLGTRSYAVVRSSGSDNDIIFEADTVGAASDGIQIVFDDDGSVLIPGTDEVASYDPVSRTLTVTVKTGATEARHVVAAVEAAYALGNVPLTARLDPLDGQSGGQGLIDVTPPGGTAGETSGGSGVTFDKQSGLQIVNGGTTHVLSFADAQTVEDMLNTLNSSDAGVLAQINQNASGIDIRSRLSGADFMIGENGGTTASRLGLRTFTAETRLDDLNFAVGVADRTGTDFTITLSDGTQIDVDVSGLETVGEVLDLINTLAGSTLQARLALYGNGVELVDQTSGTGTLTVSRSFLSTAAIGLGLIPEGQQSSTPALAGATAEATLVSAGPNNDLTFSAIAPGTELNDVVVAFQATGAEAVTYDPVGRTLTFDIIAGSTNANTVISLLAADPVAGALFTASLDAGDGTPNDGTGLVDDGATATMSGGSQVLSASDVNPLETEGIFTALSRLYASLKANDVLGIQRAIELLDEQVLEINFSRAELGARQQGLDSVQQRLESENVDLQAVLSEDLDADITEVISNLTARQTAFEAAMRSIASTFQMTLLDYL
jgi:flagellin-like hook-associated protein FlgL